MAENTQRVVFGYYNWFKTPAITYMHGDRDWIAVQNNDRADFQYGLSRPFIRRYAAFRFYALVRTPAHKFRWRNSR